jgi:hypothetical protein
MSVYGASIVKRLSKVQQAELDERLLAIAAKERPNSVRGLYYMAMGEGLVDKDAEGKRNNYMRVQRRILQMRRDGRMPYGWITDGSRTVHGYIRYEEPEDFAAYAAGLYRKDYWATSRVRVEVWVEKDAMAGKLHSDESAFLHPPLLGPRGDVPADRSASAGVRSAGGLRRRHLHLLCR